MCLIKRESCCGVFSKQESFACCPASLLPAASWLHPSSMWEKKDCVPVCLFPNFPVVFPWRVSAIPYWYYWYQRVWAVRMWGALQCPTNQLSCHWGCFIHHQTFLSSDVDCVRESLIPFLYPYSPGNVFLFCSQRCLFCTKYLVC